MMMSKCFIGFLISDLGEPNIYHDSGGFYKNQGILLGSFWRGSYFGDSEVPLLVPLTSRWVRCGGKRSFVNS